jgi:pilus assembly protein FimV
VLPLLHWHAEYRALRTGPVPGITEKNQLMGMFGMFRKSAVAAALLLVTVASNSFALGLGEIDMQSALNQPMRAVIDLTSASGTDLSQVKVSIASAEAHRRAGLTRSRLLGDFRFKVEQDNRGQAVIRISSTDTIHEPFLEFMLELTWPKGRLMRQYTVLVDPPLTMPAAPAIPASPVSGAPRATPVAAEPARRFAAPRPGTRTARTPASSSPGSYSASSYGPVKRSETLWTIARRVRPDSDVSMEQMMLALQRANPGAFQNNNINNLKAGSTLTIPSRADILSISAQEARNEANRQYQAWKAGTAGTVDVATGEKAEETTVTEAAPAVVATEKPASAVMTESRLQLTAPEDDTIQGAAAAGDPQAGDAESGDSNIEQQLALATETAEANRAQSEEMQSRVTELEEQLQTMQRLLELKDDQLASMQNQQAAAALEETPEPAVAEAEAETETDTPAGTEEAGTSAEAAGDKKTLDVGGIVNKLMDNPLLAGLGVLVAMLLGGFIWASTRRKDSQGIFDDEMTLEKRLEAEATSRESEPLPPVTVNQTFAEPAQPNPHDTDEGDPLTEADVYLAYGRIQQAEDVLQAALEKTPDDAAMRLKLLEVYHAGGNITAFDREASDFRDTVTEGDPAWLRVATMGYELSPENELYRAAASNANNLDFDMDLTGMDDLADRDAEEKAFSPDDLGLDMETREDTAEKSPENIEYNLDDLDTADITFDETLEDIEDEDTEGLLDASDEVSTKLDLARAYLDMGDPEGARSILDEVLEEGNEAQKDEAGKLIAELA